MMRRVLPALVAVVGLLVISGFFMSRGGTRPDPGTAAVAGRGPADPRSHGFDVDVVVDGQPLTAYPARGILYVEAIRGAEYQLRVRNPLPVRVAVALSVDGLNTIDARRTTAWDASKWVIGPYQTITISGWQMSSNRARRFYFTTERDSYASKIGQPANLGVISAVFFRERRPIEYIGPPVRENEESQRDRSSEMKSAPEASAAGAARAGRGPGPGSPVYQPKPDDDYAATGIGRSVRHDVEWVDMNLDPRAVAEVKIRYEYRAELTRLGIIPRPHPAPDPLSRRERATGFSPEPE
jgi:hypothetical protein